MALNYFKIRRGISLDPQPSTTVTAQGDVDFNAGIEQLEVFTTQVEDITTNVNTQTLSNKTLQKIVGVVVVDSTTTGSSQALPSADVAGTGVEVVNAKSAAGVAAAVL